MDELKRYSPLLGLICMLFFAGGIATATLFDDEAPQRQPIIIYQVDNAGTEMFGKVTDKGIIDGRYYIEVKPYGKFLVTREQYNEIEIGQDMPEYLKKRGS